MCYEEGVSPCVANMFAVQEGIANSKSDPAAKAYLMGIMDQLQEVLSDLCSLVYIHVCAHSRCVRLGHGGV